MMCGERRALVTPTSTRSSMLQGRGVHWSERKRARMAVRMTAETARIGYFLGGVSQLKTSGREGT